MTSPWYNFPSNGQGLGIIAPERDQSLPIWRHPAGLTQSRDQDRTLLASGRQHRSGWIEPLEVALGLAHPRTRGDLVLFVAPSTRLAFVIIKVKSGDAERLEKYPQMVV